MPQRTQPAPTLAIGARDGGGLPRLWLTVDEAHQVTGVSKTELYVALQTGDLPGTQRGKNGKWRMHVEDLDAWMRGASQ